MTSIRGPQPLFAVFSDQQSSTSASSINPAISSFSQNKAMATTSKRAKAERTAHPSSKSLPSKKASFTVYQDEAAEADKENLGGLRRNNGKGCNGKPAGKKANSKTDGLQNLTHIPPRSTVLGTSTKSSNAQLRPIRDFDDMCKSTAYNKQTNATTLWADKQPFSTASPETATRMSANAKAKSIYELPGLAACQPTSVNALRGVQPLRASGRSHFGGEAVSRPNKVNRGTNRPTQGGFAIHRDENTGSDPREEGPRRTPGTPQFSVQAAIRANQRVRELTESPLADVTQAYTGRGAFTNSPLSVCTADSGFSSSASCEVSPMPGRSLSAKDLEELQLQLIKSITLADGDMQDFATSNLNGKRKISQLSTARMEVDQGQEQQLHSQVDECVEDGPVETPRCSESLIVDPFDLILDSPTVEVAYARQSTSPRIIAMRV